MKLSERTLVTLALLLLAAVFCLLAARLNRGAALLPLAAGLPVVAGCAVQLVRDLRRDAAEEDSNRAGRGAVASALALLALLYLLGFLVAIPLYAGFTWKRSGASWLVAASVAGGVLATLLVGFQLLLQVDLYQGALWAWLA